MARLVTLEELEAYRQEVIHANREGRVPRYRDPREVFNDNPNREEGFLVELAEDEIAALEEERQRAYQDEVAIREQVIQEIQGNGNVIYSDSTLPASATPDEHNVTTPDLTEEQATALYDASQPNQNVTPIPPVGALENPANSPSIAPEESVVPAPGSIEGAPEPMQSIVEAAALQGNTTGSVHQNLVSTPNPEPSANDNADTQNVEAVTPATGGDNPTTVADLNLPDLTEPTSVPSPTAPADIASQPQEAQDGNITDKIVDPGTQQFQPVPGENAGPTVPGADTVQTPTLSDEAAVPSEPTNADAVNVTENPAASSDNPNPDAAPDQTAQPDNQSNQTP